MQFNYTQEQLKEAIADALTGPEPSPGWVKILWANKSSVNSERVVFGFNYQRKGAFYPGQVMIDKWSGERECGAVCKALVIFA